LLRSRSIDGKRRYDSGADLKAWLVLTPIVAAALIAALLLQPMVPTQPTIAGAAPLNSSRAAP